MQPVRLPLTTGARIRIRPCFICQYSIIHPTGGEKDRSAANRDVLKMLGLSGNPAQALEGFGKTWDTKYQIPKLSARTNTSTKDSTSAISTPTVSTSSMSNSDLNSSKSMGFMSGMHSFGSSNYMLASKVHGGRASSVSPKYNSGMDSASTGFSKDIHAHKSSSADASHHQSSGHHLSSTSSLSSSSSLSQSSRYGHN